MTHPQTPATPVRAPGRGGSASLSGARSTIPKRLRPCGTVAAHQRHTRRRETCNLCRAAEADRQHTFTDARRLLRQRFPDEFAALRAQEGRGAIGWLKAQAELVRRHHRTYVSLLNELRAT